MEKVYAYAAAQPAESSCGVPDQPADFRKVG